ncbi:alcohol dehydrogenase [Sporolactobacillus inulinus]|uniref:Alcohol dehydrogenase n=1 Tax=Sporolactobacillus inulinus TaxID=2078 RepID=A0A4Y1Z950_9BACL|nr:alcohol dehydrogenase [Sporolactobacillus inulinus]
MRCLNKSFHALVVNKIEQSFSRRIESLTLNDLPEAGVLLRVCYSGINYKDSLAAIPNGHILKDYPFVPGIDLSGIVVSSEDPRFKKATRSSQPATALVFPILADLVNTHGSPLIGSFRCLQR